MWVGDEVQDDFEAKGVSLGDQVAIGKRKGGGSTSSDRES
jgi:hypothetical protein